MGAYISIMIGVIFLLFWILLVLKKEKYIKEDDDKARIARRYVFRQVVKNLK